MVQVANPGAPQACKPAGAILQSTWDLRFFGTARAGNRAHPATEAALPKEWGWPGMLSVVLCMREPTCVVNLQLATQVKVFAIRSFPEAGCLHWWQETVKTVLPA